MIIKSRLYPFLVVDSQSGFREKRGVGDSLLFFTQKIEEWLVKGRKGCGIFFDISKTFDKVWHDGLMYKMRRLKVPLA